LKKSKNESNLKKKKMQYGSGRRNPNPERPIEGKGKKREGLTERTSLK
jgi:hypothetical protein